MNQIYRFESVRLLKQPLFLFLETDKACMSVRLAKQNLHYAGYMKHR